MASGTFAGKVALVTGAGAGIGRAVAHTLAQDGARVAVLDRDGEAAQRVAAEVGDEHAIALTADVTHEPDVVAAVRDTLARWGRLDLLHNHAGILPGADGSVLDVAVATFRHALEVNVVGQLIVAQQVGRHMASQGGGVIVNSASDLSFIALPGTVSYVTSKTAILGLTRSMATDLAPLGIRVNAVCPGFVSTAMTAGLESDPDLMATMRESYLIKELGSPADVAGVVSFLLSENSRFMTGTPVVVDGGHLVG